MVVAIDPWALLQAGFWLSFVAVGVLFASEGAHSPSPRDTIKSVANVQEKTWTWRRLDSIFTAMGRTAREQWVVTLALTPLTLLLFGQVSVVGLLANAVAIPWVTLVVTPLAMLGVLWAPLWDVAAWAVHALAVGLQALAALPWATVSVPAPPVWAGAAGVAGGVLLALRLPWTLRLLGVPLAAAGAALAGAAARAGAIRTAGRRHRAGQRRDRAHRAAMRCCTTPGRATAPKAMPGTACWCRCCARWACGSTPSC